MRIGVLAASDDNLYAAALVARAQQRGHELACVVYCGQSRLSRLTEHVRVAGVAATLRRIGQELRPAASGSDSPAEVLAAYARECGVGAWRPPLSRIAARDGLAILKASSLNAPAAVEFVQRHQPDLLLNAAGTIYRRPMLQAAPRGMLNAHMGRLPAMRGMNVLEWSLMAVEPLGVTIHFVEPGIDTGGILAFREIQPRLGDTIAALRCRSYAVSVDTMVRCIDELQAGTTPPCPQLPTEGRQYFVMHPRLLQVAEHRLTRRIAAS